MDVLIKYRDKFQEMADDDSCSFEDMAEYAADKFVEVLDRAIQVEQKIGK